MVRRTVGGVLLVMMLLGCQVPPGVVPGVGGGPGATATATPEPTATAEPTPTPDTRLEPNAELREACWFMTNTDIRALLRIRDQDRLEGYTQDEMIDFVYASCSTAPDPASCLTCSVLVIDQVYSIEE